MNPLNLNHPALKITEQEHREQRAQLVFDHRRSGGQINREFAQHLADLGFATKEGKPFSVETLHHDYQEFVKHLAIFNRETYQHQQVLQLMRLEHNLKVLNAYIESVKSGDEENPYRMHPMQMVRLLGEIRQTTEAISKLTGANAPVEVVVTQRLESEVETILGILRQELTDEEFQKVAGALAKGMGLVRDKARGKELSGVDEAQQGWVRVEEVGLSAIAEVVEKN